MVQATLSSPTTCAARRVYLATGSSLKLRQYSHLFSEIGLAVEGVRHIPTLYEPQIDGTGASNEAALVAEPLKTLSRFAARSNGYPIVAEDTMLFIDHFNREVPALPGPDTKRWWLALGNRGLLDLMKGSQARGATYVCQLGISAAPGDYRIFRSEITGSIATTVRSSPAAEANFPRTNATYFHPIFVPQGSMRTYAEMEENEFTEFDYRRAVVAKAAKHLTDVATTSPQGELFSGDRYLKRCS